MRVFKKWIALTPEFRNLRLNYIKRMKNVKGARTFIWICFLLSFGL